ncbi:MAG: hypothetical protein RI531_04680 [Haloferacaceae archaeon]|nr:hypothetical protein [Haloferacaceae archaeon]
MDPQYIGSALMQLPRDTVVHQVILETQQIVIHYSGVSSQEVEQAGWYHTDTTDYYGVATWPAVDMRTPANSGFDFGL